MRSGKIWRCDIVFLRKSWIAVQCTQAGPCASRNGESGQVGNEAATANLRECRSQGSPFLLLCFRYFQRPRDIETRLQQSADAGVADISGSCDAARYACWPVWFPCAKPWAIGYNFLMSYLVLARKYRPKDFGSIVGPAVMKVLGIESRIAKGLALGASSHGLGTATAIQLGAVEGALSGLAIGLMGIVTAILVPVIHLVLDWIY